MRSGLYVFGRKIGKAAGGQRLGFPRRGKLSSECETDEGTAVNQ